MSKYELVVMGFLMDRPMHGYQINQEVKIHRMDSLAKISPPMVYKILTKLEGEGMINSKVEREGLMPERKVYRLTSKGKERLAHLVERSLMDKNITYDLSNMGYFFLFALPKEKALECLKQKKDFLEKSVKSLKKRLEDFRGKTPLNRFLVIEKDLDRFKSELYHVKRLIRKVDECEKWRFDAFI